ncbi:hypothetical protein LQ757_11550 [Agromyces sp. SYSU K20354]|uniref:hypothetical protein n=1 Tax=Agromyces cavernae TaxID=2898659 RepID=UPI001E4820C8|nr:hypothetical protein [Agromyces cavernae]MCD2442906.1 hypothetical protein [Agromyces cavernae]
MMRTALRAPDGPAEVIADVLRLLAVLSIVVAAIGWGPLSGLSFLAVLAVMLIPRLLHLRAGFDIAFGIAVLFSTWSSVLGVYHTTRWWDVPMHFLTNGLLAALAFVVLVRLGVLADPATLPHPMLSATVATTALGLTMGVIWELFEWFGRAFIDDDILVGYADTLGDLLAGGLGSVVAGLSMRFLMARPRARTQPEVKT